MTLRYKPRSLVIATNSNLTDRARDFANWLLTMFDDLVCTVWNPFDLEKDQTKRKKKEI